VRRLHAVKEWLDGLPADPDRVPVNVMVGFYAG
jgi:hypothetical protein